MFKTAFEIDQRWIIDLAADRAPYVCQSQSLNVFLPADVHKKTLHDIHFEAWKKGVKIALLLPLEIAAARRGRRHQGRFGGMTTGAKQMLDRRIANGIGQPLPLAAQCRGGVE